MDELQFYQRKLESGSNEFKAEDRVGDTAIERMANSSHVCLVYHIIYIYILAHMIYILYTGTIFNILGSNVSITAYERE